MRMIMFSFINQLLCFNSRPVIRTFHILPLYYILYIYIGSLLASSLVLFVVFLFSSPPPPNQMFLPAIPQTETVMFGIQFRKNALPAGNTRSTNVSLNLSKKKAWQRMKQADERNLYICTSALTTSATFARDTAYFESYHTCWGCFSKLHFKHISSLSLFTLCILSVVMCILWITLNINIRCLTLMEIVFVWLHISIHSSSEVSWSRSLLHLILAFISPEFIQPKRISSANSFHGLYP